MKHISKSNFITGLQCEKALYLKKFHSQLANEITLSKKNIFEVGTQVGLLAQDLFPGGIDSSPEDYSKISESIDYTKSLIQNGTEIIYEAAFEYKNVRCFVDVLVKKENEWHIYEVKSSTHISETYINDVALQYFVLRKCGLKVRDASVIHIDNSYVKIGDLEINAFNFYILFLINFVFLCSVRIYFIYFIYLLCMIIRAFF